MGVFTGYTLCGLASPRSDAHVACDVNEEWTSVARRYWAEAGVADKINCVWRRPSKPSTRYCVTGRDFRFQLSLMLTSRTTTITYERALKLMRRGGLIILIICCGAAGSPIRAFKTLIPFARANEKWHHDERVFVSRLPIRDGVSLAVKQCD